jgi:hypothetical protein
LQSTGLAEVAGLAGALVRLGVHDEELFAEVREVNYGEIYDEDPTSIVEGLKKAAEYQVGLTPAKVLSSSMEHVPVSAGGSAVPKEEVKPLGSMTSWGPTTLLGR